MPTPQTEPDWTTGRRAGSALVAVLACAWFGIDLASEPHFVDESAYISQAFYGDLLIDGLRNDLAWLEYAGYDLPPMPKYLIDLAFRAGGVRRPGPGAMRAWYARTDRRFVDARALAIARVPSVMLGVVGAVALLGLGSSLFDRRVGAIAALLLIANPLYRMHARRAMSDVPAEAFVLAALAVGAWAWRRLAAGGRIGPGPAAALAIGSGVLVGLATLAKLNGVLAGMILAAWGGLAIGLPGLAAVRKAAIVGLIAATGVVALATFALLNPFLFARPAGPLPPAMADVARLGPAGRLDAVFRHRVEVSRLAMTQFPADALPRLGDRAAAMAVQGFGRFGPLGPRGGFDSTARYEWRQDRGAIAWAPLVAAGFIVALAWGRREVRDGRPPTAWAGAIAWAMAVAVVGSFLPLAWDRYFLPIQATSALMAGVAIVAGWDWVRRPRPGAGS